MGRSAQVADNHSRIMIRHLQKGVTLKEDTSGLLGTKNVIKRNKKS